MYTTWDFVGLWLYGALVLVALYFGIKQNIHEPRKLPKAILYALMWPIFMRFIPMKNYLHAVPPKSGDSERVIARKKAVSRLLDLDEIYRTCIIPLCIFIVIVITAVAVIMQK